MITDEERRIEALHTEWDLARGRQKWPRDYGKLLKEEQAFFDAVREYAKRHEMTTAEANWYLVRTLDLRFR
jgi:hypothetical protein